MCRTRSPVKPKPPSARFTALRGLSPDVPGRSLDPNSWLQHVARSLDNAFGDRVPRQARNVVNPQFVHHLLPMFLHRLDANGQISRDLFVCPSFGAELENFRFA